MKIDSEKFQKAWNELGVAVFKFIQVVSEEGADKEEQKEPIHEMPIVGGKDDVKEQSDIVEDREIVRTKYAGIPYNINGQYVFKRLVDDPQGRFYEIIEYHDGTCSFKLNCDISDSETLQNLKDGQQSILPSDVAIVEGNITSNMSIEIKKEGEAELDGNMVKILSPMVVAFKS